MDKWCAIKFVHFSCCLLLPCYDMFCMWWDLVLSSILLHLAKKSSLNLTQCRFSTLNIFLYLFCYFFMKFMFMVVHGKVWDISQLSVTVSSWVRHYQSSSSGKLQSFDIKPHSFATSSCKMQNKLLKDIKTLGRYIKKYKCTFELILVHSIVLSLSLSTVHNLLLLLLKVHSTDMR